MTIGPECRGRISFDEMYVYMCQIVSERSTCLKSRTGCIIVQNGQIVALGYNGAPKSMPHCSVLGCTVDYVSAANGPDPDACRGVHAEQNALIQAGLDKTRGATLYINAYPCRLCAKLMIQAEIERVAVAEGPGDQTGLNLLRQAGIEVVRVDHMRSRCAFHGA